MPVTLYVLLLGVVLIVLYVLLLFVKKKTAYRLLTRGKIIDRVSDCFIMLNNNFEVHDFNKAFEETFKDILCINIKDNFMCILRLNEFLNITPEYIESSIEKSFFQQTCSHLESHIIKNDFDKWFSVITSYVSRNKSEGIFVILRDITYEKRQKEMDIERIKLKTLAQVTGGLFYDENTPLFQTKNYAEDIDNIINGEDISLEKMASEIGYLKYKSRSILANCNRSLKSVRRVKSQTFEIYNEGRTEFNLKDLILGIVKKDSELKTLMKHLGCKYILQGDSEIIILGYPQNLAVVIKNVIKNAFESYTNQNKLNKIVEISLIRKSNQVIISIKDDGSGIMNSVKNDIFLRPLKTRNLKSDGEGISLFFAVPIIVGQLGGNIWFQSEEWKGTTFFISIPVESTARETEKLF